jgi:chromosome segregation ATPase
VTDLVFKEDGVPTPTDKPMDLAQATQRITWLDEERRHDHAETARLAQEVAGMVAIIKDQAVKIRETGDRLNAIEGALGRVARLEDTITQTRSELPPLRDADLRLQEDARRQGKDREVQADPAARQVAEINARLERLDRAIQGAANRLVSCDMQTRQQAERLADLGTRFDKVSKTVDETIGRLQLMETRDKDSVNRETAVRAQAARLEASQAQALEEVKRSLARVEILAGDIQQIRRDMTTALKEETQQRQNDVAPIAEQKLVIADIDRRVEDLSESVVPLTARVEQVEEIAGRYAEALQRMGAIEENLSFLQSMYKSLQEVEDQHWNTDMPMIQHTVDESSARSQTNFATNQELVAASQALKEDVRQLRVDLQAEHTYGDSLAAALRGVIEEDIQNRLVVAHKQLQSIRRMAQEPVEGRPDA